MAVTFYKHGYSAGVSVLQEHPSLMGSYATRKVKCNVTEQAGDKVIAIKTIVVNHRLNLCC